MPLRTLLALEVKYQNEHRSRGKSMDYYIKKQKEGQNLTDKEITL